MVTCSLQQGPRPSATSLPAPACVTEQIESRAECSGDEGALELCHEPALLVGAVDPSPVGGVTCGGKRLSSPGPEPSRDLMSWQSSLRAVAMLRKQYLPPIGSGFRARRFGVMVRGVW